MEAQDTLSEDLDSIIEEVLEVAVEVFMKLKKLYEEDEKLFERISAVVEDWLDRDVCSEDILGINLALLLGREVGELIYYLLTIPSVIVIRILDAMSEQLDTGKEVLNKLRELIAKYHHRIYIKLERQKHPEHVYKMSISVVNRDPLMIRITAILFNGKKVVLEFCEVEIEQLLKKIVKEKATLITEILSQEAETSSEDEDIEDVTKSKNITRTLSPPSQPHSGIKIPTHM